MIAQRFAKSLVALCAGLLCFWGFGLRGQAVGSPGARGVGVPEVAELERAEAIARLEAIRHYRIEGGFVFDFVLKQRPRRGDEEVFEGRLFGKWEGGVPLFRLKIVDAHEVMTEVIVEGGASPRAWKRKQGERVFRPVSSDGLGEPLADRLSYTALDLCMGYLYWTQAEYIGPERMRGQPAHVFDLFAPAGQNSDVVRARVWLHNAYNALIESRLYDKTGAQVRSMQVLSFKEVDEQWMVRAMDYLDEKTRDKSRFSVRRAAMGVALPADFFTPLWLDAAPVVPQEKWRDLN